MLLRTVHWLLLHSNTIVTTECRPLLRGQQCQCSAPARGSSVCREPVRQRHRYTRGVSQISQSFSQYSVMRRGGYSSVHSLVIHWPLHKYYLVSKTIFLYTIFSIKYYTGVLKSIIIKYFQFKTRSNIVQT